MVGTPSRIVVRVSAISASVRSASKRRTTAIAEPDEQRREDPGRETEHVRERRRAEHDVVGPELERVRRSSGRPHGGSRASGSRPSAGPRCREVKRITAGSAPSRSTGCHGGSPDLACELAFVLQEDARVDTSSRASISGRASEPFSGTTIAPSRRAPSPAATNAGPFGSISATRSPGSTAAARAERVAAACACPSSSA